jgi:hypothetical protein
MAAVASLILTLHLAWILLVIFGVLWTRGRPAWTAIHIAALVWGVAVEAGPWPCPLTLAEQYFEVRAGAAAWQGGFVMHWLDAIVYPHVPGWVITVAGVGVCALNLAVYLRRFIRWKETVPARHKTTPSTPHRFLRFPRPKV